MGARIVLAVAALCALACVSPWTTVGAADPARPASPATPRHAAWTFAVYANEDNDLQYSWRQFTLPALRELPANADVNVVAMVDWRSAGRGVQLLQFTGRRVKVVASWPDKDFGSGATFTWFLKQVTRRFPSDHLAVDICDHGYGWRYVSRDFTSHDRITMPELRAAIVRARRPIDLLCFDACNMANVEAVDEIGSTGLVRYEVASEETVDQDGIPYGIALRPLLTDPGRTPEQVAADMVDGWQMYYRPLRCFNWVCLSALDVGRVVQARADITAWVTRLRADLRRYRARYAADLHHSIYAWDCWYVDLADVARRLAADPAIADTTLKDLSATVADDVAQAVPAHANGSYARRFKGLTIWWGTGADWRGDQATYRRQIAFARQTGWYRFLQAYNTGHLPGPSQPPVPRIARAGYGLTDIAFADARHGWATGYDNVSSEAVILRTTDGGRRWTTTSRTLWDAYMTSSLSFLGTRRAWTVGSEGDSESLALRTTTGGRRWSWQHSRTVQYLNDVDFVDAAHGWLVGSRGTLLHTSDGGRTWAGARGVSATDLWSVAFADAAHGWVAGGNAARGDGVIEHTGDGGATWTTQATVPGSIVYKVCALDDARAWAVGGSPVTGAGVVLHTTDGGLTWTTSYSGPAVPWLAGAAFSDPSTGWVVGEHGTVLHTADGGRTWAIVAVPTSEDLTSVWFTGAADGWIVGDGEAMLHTTDGGVTWRSSAVAVKSPDRTLRRHRW